MATPVDYAAFIKHQKDGILTLAKRYKAENVRIFGSVVRGEGEANEGSDVDFLVSFLPGATLFDQAGLIEDLSTLLDKRVDVVSERAINRHLKPIILQEAQPL